MSDVSVECPQCHAVSFPKDVAPASAVEEALARARVATEDAISSEKGCKAANQRNDQLKKELIEETERRQKAEREVADLRRMGAHSSAILELLRVRADSLTVLLLSLEWSGTKFDRPCCPKCGRLQEPWSGLPHGHTENCKLAAALKEGR